MKKITERYGTTLRIFDNGGKTADRYNIFPPRWAGKEWKDRALWLCLGSSAQPFHPQGVGMLSTGTPGPHLGKRIHWDQLPPDVQRFARQTFPVWAPAETL